MRQGVFLLLFVAMQLGLGWQMHKVRPALAIVEVPPHEVVARLQAFNDGQWQFRLLGMQLQNTGDTFGRFTGLRKYDYQKLGMWLALLDRFDDRSDWMPSLASYYYGMTPKTEDVPVIVAYLERHADRYPGLKWWWYAQGTYLANHKMKDKDTALRLAYKLSEAPAEKPLWARQMPAFIHEQRGELEDARKLVEAMAAEFDTLSEGEKKFIVYFLKERLGELEAARKEGDAFESRMGL